MENNDIDDDPLPKFGGKDSIAAQHLAQNDFVRRMRALVVHFDGVARLSRKGRFPESTVKKWVDGTSDPSRTRCVQLAKATGVSLLWLVSGLGPMWPGETDGEPRSIDTDTIKLAVRLVEEAIKATGRRRPLPDKVGDSVVLVFDLLSNGMSVADVQPLVKKIVGLAQE